jgi:4-amino-4-deoxy-L-arabinose transferase-like glycosyltransferase
MDFFGKLAIVRESAGMLAATAADRVGEWFPAPAAGRLRRDRAFWLSAALLVILTDALVLPSGAFPLFEPDEGRRAEISREILVNGDWVVTTLNFQPYRDKPPLFHWLMAISYLCFGVSEATARVVPALVTLTTVLTTFALGRRLFGQGAALLGSLGLVLMVGFAGTGRLVGLDGTLTLLITFAMLGAHEAMAGGGKLRGHWWIASAIACGLGLLTKGPIALVLVIPPVWLYARLTVGICRPTLRHWIGFLAASSAVAAPWVILILGRDPQMLYEFLIDHHLHRFTGDFAHEEPWWYYLPILCGGCMPLTLLLPHFLTRLLSRQPEVRQLRSKPMILLLLWAGWCVAFFTLSHGKLPLYVMPVFPAVALLAGWQVCSLLAEIERNQVSAFARRGGPWACLVLVGALWTGAHIWARQRGLTGDGARLLPVAAAAGAALLSYRFARGQRGAVIGWCLFGLLGFGMNMDIVHRLIPAFAWQKSPLASRRSLTELARHGNIAVASPSTSWGSLTFLCRGDFWATENGSLETLIQFLRCHSRTFVVLDHFNYQRLRSTGLPDLRIELLQAADKGIVVFVERDAQWASAVVGHQGDE